jgi:CheY-like chemotaxis protein
MDILNILVIDDDVVMFDDIEPRQQWFARRLSAYGHKVTAAHSSSEAYRFLRERKFDLAFFDHDLGEEANGSTIASEVLYHPDDYQCPRAVWVHSLNSIGAANIASKFKSAGVPTRVLDYSVLRVMPFNVFGALMTELVPELEPSAAAVAEHKYPLGAVVDVDVEIDEPSHATGVHVCLKGTCRLIVVGHLRDADKTPLYVLSDLAVRYPVEDPTFSQSRLVYKYAATLLESGYEEESLRPTGGQMPLMGTMAEWLRTGD